MMRRFMMFSIASMLSTLLALTAGPARALTSAAEWLEALRPVPLRGRNWSASREALPVAVLAFAPGSTRLQQGSVDILDQLAAALTSPELAKDSFQIGWWVEPNAQSPLSVQRAAAVVTYLEANPGIGPRRLDARRLAEIPPGITEQMTTDNLTIRVLNLGLTED